MADLEARIDAAQADIARFDAFFALIAILADPQRFTAEIEAFQSRATMAKQAEAAIAEQRRLLGEQVQTRRATLESEGAALFKRLVTAEKETERLHTASAQHKKLVQAWTRFGEGEDVASGRVSPRQPALTKARKAHGIKDDWQEDPSVPFDTVSPTVPGLFPNRTRRTERHNRRV
jgi:hypothetical protein